MQQEQREIVGLVKRLHVRMNQAIDDVLKEYGMARSQYRVLYFVGRAGQLTQKDLQQFMLVEAATLSGLTDVLEHKGWLVRLEHPSDKRAKLLQLTPSGKKVLENIPNPAAAAEKRLLRGLSAQERRQFQRQLEQLIANLE
jgi:DNA-binding MarR family transcriptional regulator